MKSTTNEPEAAAAWELVDEALELAGAEDSSEPDEVDGLVEELVSAESFEQALKPTREAKVALPETKARRLTWEKREVVFIGLT